MSQLIILVARPDKPGSAPERHWNANGTYTCEILENFKRCFDFTGENSVEKPQLSDAI